MTGRSSFLVVSIAALLAVIPREAAASDADPWFGRDKALHFGVSAAIASSGYALGTALFEPRWKAATFGGGLAIAAGAGKELADLAGLGDPSWRDFTWDLLGTAVGLGVAFAIDAVVRKDPASSGATTGSKLVVQF